MRELTIKERSLICYALSHQSRDIFTPEDCLLMDELTDMFDDRSEWKKRYDGPLRPLVLRPVEKVSV